MPTGGAGSPLWCSVRADTGVFPPRQGAALAQVLHQAPERLGVQRVRWRLADLRQVRVLPWLATYSLSGIWQALRRLGVRPKRGRLSVHSPDPDYAAKCFAVAQACALARRAPERVRVLYGDEFSLYRHPTLAPVYTAGRVTPKARLSWRANTRYRISGALDGASGQVTATSAHTMGVVGLCHFLEHLRAVYPHHQLLLIWDNWPVHRHPKVLATAAQLHIHIRWLPTYAPWTNPIEKLWRWLKQTLLHHHPWADHWDELKVAVQAFLDQFASGSRDLLRYVGLLPVPVT